MNTTRSQTYLRNLKTTPFAKQHVFLGYPHIVEANVHMTTRRVVFTKDLHSFENFYPFSIRWHEYLRLLFAWCGIRAGLHHGNHDFAARITGTADVVLFAVDDPLISFKHGLGADVFRIR